MKLSIIIPAYNEEKTILQILNKIKESKINFEKEIIVVDDGSTDNTSQLITTNFPEIILLKNSKNEGKGSAVRTGIENATGDIILIQDADLEYSPDDYPKLLEGFEDEKINAVYGSRNLKQNSKSTWYFYFGGRFLTWLINLLFGSNLTDVNTGYKLFRKEVFQNIELESKGFEFCVEITAKLLKNHYRIVEVPITYNPRSIKQGKKIRAKDGFSSILRILRDRISF